MVRQAHQPRQILQIFLSIEFMQSDAPYVSFYKSNIIPIIENRYYPEITNLSDLIRLEI